jgi:hypothetical protein
MSTSRRLQGALALGMTLTAFGAPVATAQQDLRNADNRSPITTAPAQDLRLPDRRVPAPPASPPQTYRDLRSADARDGRRVVIVPASPSVVESGFDLSDAAVGAGVLAALVAFAGATSVTVRRRRRVVPAH